MIVHNVNEEERSRVIKKYEASSAIHSSQWKQLYKAIAKGQESIDATIQLSTVFAEKKKKQQQQQNELINTGLTQLHNYALQCDFPMVKELLRLGAKLDVIGPVGETPLYTAILNPNTDKDYRILEVEVVRYLLQVGANPNIRITNVANHAPRTPLQGACKKQNMELCEWLLQYGADPSIPDFQNRTAKDYLNKKNRELFQQLCTEYATKSKPPRICQCGSGKPFDLCHGTGKVQLEDDMYCICLSGRLYSKCCKKRDIFYYRDANFDHFENRTVTGAANDTLLHYLKERYDREGKLDPDAYLFDDGHGGPISNPQSIYSDALRPLMENGFIDRAYHYAVSQKNMFMAVPWIGSTSMPTQERKLRKEEWNNHIDTYINKVARTVGDFRSKEEIERLNKISECGGPLYKTCANPKCDKETTEEKLFKRCSQCKYTL
jgi:hypothetical protein